MSQKIGILDYLLGLFNYRKLLLGNFFVLFILGYIIALLLPKYYKAEVVILPPAPELSSSLTELAMPVTSFLGINMLDEEVNKYLAILKSRTLREKIVQKMDLLTVYDCEYLDEALSKLTDNTEIGIDNEGTIRISVLDSSPQRAAELAGLYARYLDSMYTETSIKKAHFDRIYLQEQVESVKAGLDSIETELKHFQEKYGVISFPEQIESSIKAYADLAAQKIAEEIEYEVMRKSRRPDHPEVLTIKHSISALEDKLNILEEATRATDSIILPLKDLPIIGKKYADLYREVETRSKVYALLLAEFERAKIREAKDTPQVQILDQPVPPRKRAKPKRLLFAGIVAISTTLILLYGLLFKVHLQIIKEVDEDRYNKYINLIRLAMFFGKK